MGTSSAYGGPKNGLVPSWVSDVDGADGDDNGESPEGQDGKDGDESVPDTQDDEKPAAAPPATAPPSLQFARGNFTRFTNNQSTGSLSKAVSGYLASTGGGGGAAKRMPNSTRVASGVAGFANSFLSEGPAEALQKFNLQGMAGRPAIEVLDALADALCPDGGTIDEAIARDAMIETLAEFASEDLGDFEDLTPEILGAFTAEVISRSITTKVINEIGTNSLHGSATDADFRQAEAMLRSYVSGAVNDALGSRFDARASMTATEIDTTISSIFSDAFDILEATLEAL